MEIRSSLVSGLLFAFFKIGRPGEVSDILIHDTCEVSHSMPFIFVYDLNRRKAHCLVILHHYVLGKEGMGQFAVKVFF